MTEGNRLMNTVLPTLHMHEAYAQELTCDLDESAMDRVPCAGHENTPRFTLGHLCTGAVVMRRPFELAMENQGNRADLPSIYDELFLRRGPGDRRLPECRSNAPSRDELIAELARQHARLDQVVRGASDELLDRPYEWKLGRLLGRHSDLVMFVCSHEALHLGQLASWRRAMGLDAAMARM